MCITLELGELVQKMQIQIGLLYSDVCNWTKKLEKNTVSANDMIVFLEKKIIRIYKIAAKFMSI